MEKEALHNEGTGVSLCVGPKSPPFSSLYLSIHQTGFALNERRRSKISKERQQQQEEEEEEDQ